jgi:Putative beta-barrel porin 2
MNKSQVFISAICTSLIAVGASAAEPQQSGLDYVLRAGVTYSDNIYLQPSPFEDGSSAIAFGGEVRGDRSTGRLRYNVAMDIMRYQYLDNSTGGETFGRGVLGGSYDFVPDNFRWNASVNFDQLREDLLQPIAPGNVEDVITFSTGPTVRGELFGVIDTKLDGHYDRAWYTGNTIDNQTVGGRLELGRQPGPGTRYGLGGSIDDVSYLSGPLSSAFDFQRSEVFLYGELNGVRTQLTGEVGYAQADGDSFDGDGPMARIRLTRQMSPSLTGYIGYRDEFPTAQAGAWVSDPTVGGGGVLNTSLVTSSPREARAGEIGFQYQRTRSDAELGFYHLNEKSLILALGDHSYDELRARVTRRFTPVSRGTLFAAYSKEDFSALAQNFDELRTGFEYGYDFTRSIGVDVRLEYRSRDSNVSGYNYNEFNGGVFIRYSGSLLGRSSTTSPNGQAR